jgi:PAS domain S-box-containing protein
MGNHDPLTKASTLPADIDDPAGYIERLTVPAWIFDQQTLAFLDVNPVAIEQYGFSRTQFLQMTIMDIRPLEDLPKLIRKTLHPSRKGPSTKEPWRHMRCDGTVFDVEITSCEINFCGRKAELVVAVPVTTAESSLAGNLPQVQCDLRRRTTFGKGRHWRIEP